MEIKIRHRQLFTGLILAWTRSLFLCDVGRSRDVSLVHSIIWWYLQSISRLWSSITQITSPIITYHSETATARTEQSGTSPTPNLWLASPLLAEPNSWVRWCLTWNCIQDKMSVRWESEMCVVWLVSVARHSAEHSKTSFKCQKF